MKTKRIIALMLCAIMVMSVFAGCGKSDENTSSDGKKTFTIGFDASFPPYGYKENGEYVGFDLDLAAEVCARNGWELVKQPINWDSKDMELNTGAIDCIWNGFTISEDRKDTYTWSEPYVDNTQVFVVKKDSGIKTKADLAGKTVIVQTASSALESLENDDNKDLLASFKSLEKVPEYNTAFLNIEAGSGDAIAMDVGVAEYQIETRGADKYEIMSEVITSEQYGIGFKKGNEELRDKVQSTLKAMVKDGKFDEIAKKWDLQNQVCLKAD